jgi:hypothetical protein
MKFKKGEKRPENAGIKKGTKQPKTILKEQLGKTLFEQTAELVDKNILEFLASPDVNTRLIATKYFAKFFRAEKKEISGDANNPIQFQIKVDKFI